MLRITKIAENGLPVTLKLEGKVHADWVSLLEQECRALLSQKKTVLLDFSDGLKGLSRSLSPGWSPDGGGIPLHAEFSISWTGSSELRRANVKERCEDAS